MKDIRKYDLAIIGGGAAGLATATHVKRCSDLSIIVISKDAHISYSECGIPFKLAGKVHDFDSLIVKTPDFFDKMGIDIELETEALSIDILNRTIELENCDILFDKLVIATGGKQQIPQPLQEYIGMEGVFTLQTLADGMKIETALLSAETMVIIGAGAIGVETAAGIAKRGISTTLVNHSPAILSRLIDPDMAEIVSEYLKSIGVTLITGNMPDSIEGKERVENVLISGERIPADVVIISTGILPDVELAKDAGLSTGELGGLRVNEHLQTFVDGNFTTDIFAGGDCCEIIDFITNKRTIVQLAPAARHMATIMANNICGKGAVLKPLLGPSIYVAGDLLIGSVGLTSKRAKSEDIDIITGYATGTTKAAYFPSSSDIHIKLIFSGDHLTGAQIIGKSGVKERIDSLAFMIKKKTTIEEMLSIETCYAPPVSTVVDPLMYAVKDAFKKIKAIT